MVDGDWLTAGIRGNPFPKTAGARAQAETIQVQLDLRQPDAHVMALSSFWFTSCIATYITLRRIYGSGVLSSVVPDLLLPEQICVTAP